MTQYSCFHISYSLNGEKTVELFHLFYVDLLKYSLFSVFTGCKRISWKFRIKVNNMHFSWIAGTNEILCLMYVRI